MAYTPTFPQYNIPQPQTPPRTSANNLVAGYVLGESDAKVYPVAPGCMAILIDMEKPVIYTKTVDQFGRPMQFKVLDYTERIQNDSAQLTPQTGDFVTKSDFETFKNEIKELLRPNKPNNYKKQGREDVNA